MIKNLIITAFALLFLNPVLVYAQPATSTATTTATTPIGLPEYSGVESSITEYLCTPTGDGSDLERCINRLYRFGITAGALVLVAMVVFAGYLYITSGETGKTKAKGILTNSIVGMAILLGSYALLYFINPSLVVFRTIQPPIFSAGNLPSCEAIGFGSDCIAIGADGSSVVITGGYADCPDGLVSVDKQVIATNGGGDDDKVCKTVWEKLKQINQSSSFTITQTFNPTGGGPSKSLCHKPNNSKTGVCADIVTKNGNWDQLCAAVKSAGMVVVNESGQSTSSCGAPRVFDTTSGNHLHIYLPASVGGSGGSTSGGSRPYCISNKEFSFLCDSPGSDPYSGRVTTASDPTIQKNINEVISRLGKAGISVGQVKQLYRPHSYGAHLRSYFEAFALISGESDEWVKSTGFFCDGTIQYVKKSDIDKLNDFQKNKIKNHFSSIHNGSLKFNTTCLSDHGFGYAVDYGSGSAAQVEKLKAVGLCHSLPGGKWNQDRDGGHYVLTEKNRNTQGCR